MATKFDIEYQVRVIDNDGNLITKASFGNEGEAETYMANAGVGEGYKVRLEVIDWHEIKMEKYRNDY